jgi:hypothetical protein
MIGVMGGDPLRGRSRATHEGAIGLRETMRGSDDLGSHSTCPTSIDHVMHGVSICTRTH